MLPYLAAAVGGAAGALARWGVTRALPPSSGGWPWATLLVNLTGCLVLGLLVAALFARHPEHPWLRALLGTGVLGGYTTFSTFAVDVVRLADGRHAAVAVGYLVASVAGGLLAAAGGLQVGHRVHAGTSRAAQVEAEVEAEVDAEEDLG